MIDTGDVENTTRFSRKTAAKIKVATAIRVSAMVRRTPRNNSSSPTSDKTELLGTKLYLIAVHVNKSGWMLRLTLCI